LALASRECHPTADMKTFAGRFDKHLGNKPP
jgi:hypothetical protein